MIVVDPLFHTGPFTTPKTPACFRNTWASHMMSTLPGEQGRAELVAFARQLKVSPDWIQYPGTRKQHFDLTTGKRLQALRLGATEVAADRLPPFNREDGLDQPQGAKTAKPAAAPPACRQRFASVETVKAFPPLYDEGDGFRGEVS